ncbi:hypothetical protein, partial [Streptomyces sp. NPDC091371]|uniref:hypothetical protein n=1 Tax=Streptomyces sp. NPDC091371 TaxID=3155303 RepID=UPI003429192F
MRAAFPEGDAFVRKLGREPGFAAALERHIGALKYPHELRRLLSEDSADLREAIGSDESFPVAQVLRTATRHHTLRDSLIDDESSRRTAQQFFDRSPEEAAILIDSPGVAFFFAFSEIVESAILLIDVPGVWDHVRSDARLLSTVHKDLDAPAAIDQEEALPALLADDGALLRLMREFRNVSVAMKENPELLAGARGLGRTFHAMADSAALARPDATAVGADVWDRFLSDRPLLEALAQEENADVLRAFGAAPDLLVSAMRRPAFREAFTSDPARFARHGEDPGALRAEIEGTGEVGFTEEGWKLLPEDHTILNLALGTVEEGRAVLDGMWPPEADAPLRRTKYLARLEAAHLALDEVPGLRGAMEGSLSVRYLLMESAGFTSTLRQRPGLLPQLLDSIDTRRTLGADPRFTAALGSNSKLYNAYMNDWFLRDMVARDAPVRRSMAMNRHMWRLPDFGPMADLFALLPGTLDIMAASEPLAEATFDIPGAISVLDRRPQIFGKFRTVLGGHTRQEVERLDTVVRAVLTKGLASLTAAADHPVVVDTLAGAPMVARALGDQPDVLPDDESFLELLGNEVLVAALEANEAVARQILGRTDLALLALREPRFVTAVAGVPGLGALLDEAPDTAALLSARPELIEVLLAHPVAVPTLRGRARLVTALLTNAGLAGELSGNPKLWDLLRAQRMLVEDAAGGSDTWRVLVTQPGLVDAVLGRPSFLRRLGRRPELQRALLSSRDRLTAEQAGKLFDNQVLVALLEGRPEVARLVFGDPALLAYAVDAPGFTRTVRQLAVSQRSFADLIAGGSDALRQAAAALADAEAARDEPGAARTAPPVVEPAAPATPQEPDVTVPPRTRSAEDTTADADPDLEPDGDAVDWQDPEIADWVANTPEASRALAAHPELEGLLFYSPGLFGAVERHPEMLSGYSFSTFAASHALTWDFEKDFQAYHDSLDVMPPGTEGYQAVKDATHGVWQGLESSRSAAEEARLSDIRERLERFSVLDRSTWDHSGRVVYGNRQGEAWFSEFATEVDRVAWGTSFQEGRVALNMALHAHVDGGSGGISFAYVLNPEDGQVDALVYARSTRRPRHGNDYRWDGHGGKAIAGPLPTTVIDQSAEFTGSVRLVEELREPGGAAAVVEGLRGGPAAATTGPVGTVGGDGGVDVADSEAARPVTVGGGPADVAGAAGFDAAGFDVEWARFGHSERNREDRDGAVDRARVLFSQVRHLPPALDTTSPYARLTPEEKVVRQLAHFILTDGLGRDDVAAKAVLRGLLAGLPEAAPDPLRRTGGAKKKNAGAKRKKTQAAQQATATASTSSTNQATPSTGSPSVASPTRITPDEARRLGEGAVKRWTEEHPPRVPLTEAARTKSIAEVARTLVTHSSVIPADLAVEVADLLVPLRNVGVKDVPASVLSELVRYPNVLVAASNQGLAAYMVVTHSALAERLSTRPKLLGLLTDSDSREPTDALLNQEASRDLLISSPELLDAVESDDDFRSALFRHFYLVGAFPGRLDIIRELLRDGRSAARKVTFSNPVFNDFLMTQDESGRRATLAKLDDNVDLAMALIDYDHTLPDVAAYRELFANQGLLSALRSSPRQTRTVLAVPGMLAVAAADPSVIEVLDGSPELSGVLVESPALAVRIAGSRDLLDVAYGNEHLAGVLSARPGAFDHLLQDTQALRDALRSQEAHVWPMRDEARSAHRLAMMRISGHPLALATFPNGSELVAKLAENQEFTEVLDKHISVLWHPHELRWLLSEEAEALRGAITADKDFPVREVLRAAIRHRKLRDGLIEDVGFRRAAAQFAAKGWEEAAVLVDSPGVAFFMAHADLVDSILPVAGVAGVWEHAMSDARVLGTVHKDPKASVLLTVKGALPALMTDGAALLGAVREFRHLGKALVDAPELVKNTKRLGAVFRAMADSASLAHPDVPTVRSDVWSRFLSDRQLLAALSAQGNSALHRAFGAAPDLLVSAMRRPAFRDAFISDPERFVRHGEDADALRAEIEGVGEPGFTEEGWRLLPEDREIMNLVLVPSEVGRAALDGMWPGDDAAAPRRAEYRDRLAAAHLALEEVPGLRDAASESESVRHLLMSQPAFAAMLRQRPALVPLVLADSVVRRNLEAEPRLMEALAANPKLYNAFLNDAFLRDVIEDSDLHRWGMATNRHMWRLPYAGDVWDLFALVPDSAALLVASEPLAAAAFRDQRVTSVLYRSVELVNRLTAIRGDGGPERIEQLNAVVRALLTKEVHSLTVAADGPAVVDTLVAHPVVARALGDHPMVLPVSDYFRQLVGNAELLAALEANETAARLILSRKNLALMAIGNPRFATAVAEVPGLGALLDHNPDVATLIADHPVLIEAFLDHPAAVPTLRGRADLVSALRGTPDLLAELSAQPKLWDLLRVQRVLVQDAAGREQVWRALVAQPGVVEAVLGRSSLLRRFARRSELQRALLSSPVPLTAAQAVKLFEREGLTAVLEGQREVAEIILGDPSLLDYALDTPEFGHELRELTASRGTLAGLVSGGPAGIREAVSRRITEKAAARAAADERATRTVPPTRTGSTGTEETVAAVLPPTPSAMETLARVQAGADAGTTLPAWQDPEIAAWIDRTPGVSETLAEHPELGGLLFYSPGLFDAVDRRPETLPDYAFTTFARSARLSWDFESDFQSYRDSLDVMPPGEEGYQAVKDATRGVWQGMRSVQLAAEEARLSEIRERLERFKAIDRSTWEHSGRVVYGNKEGASWFSDFTTEVERVAWGTSFQEGRVALNSALHAHADGGSKGISFAYVVNTEDGQVDALVYGRSSRRPRHGNDYRWDGHGKAIAGPLSTTMVEELPEFTDSVELAAKLREPGGAAAVAEGLRRGPAAVGDTPVGGVGAAEPGAPRPVTVAGVPDDVAGPAGFDAAGFDVEWARFGHSERNREDRDWAVDRARVLFSEVRHLPPALDTTSPYARLTPEEKVVRQLAHFILTDGLGRDDVAAKAVLRGLLAGLPEAAPDPLRRTGGAKKNTGAKKKAQPAGQPTGSAAASTSASTSTSTTASTSSTVRAAMSESSSSRPAPRTTPAEARRLAERAAKRWAEEYASPNATFDAMSPNVIAGITRFLTTHADSIPAGLGIEVADFLVALRSASEYEPSLSALREVMQQPEVLVAASKFGPAAFLMIAHRAAAGQLSARPKLLGFLTNPVSRDHVHNLIVRRDSTRALFSSPELLDALESDEALRSRLTIRSEIVQFLADRPDITLELFQSDNTAARMVTQVSPGFREFLKTQGAVERRAVVSKLDDNIDLTMALMDHAPVLTDASAHRKLFASEGLLSALSSHPRQAKTVLAIPGMLDVAAADPEVVGVLDGNPDLSDVLIESPDLALRIAGSRQLLDAAYGNPNLAAVLSARPAAFADVLDVPDALRDRLASQEAYTPPPGDPVRARAKVAMVRIGAHPLALAAFPDEQEFARKLAGEPGFTKAFADHIDVLEHPHELRRLLSDDSKPLRDAMATDPDFPVRQVLRMALRYGTLRNLVSQDMNRRRSIGQFFGRHPESVEFLLGSPGGAYFLTAPDLEPKLFKLAGVAGAWEAVAKDVHVLAAMHKDSALAYAVWNDRELLPGLTAGDGELFRLVREFPAVSHAIQRKPAILTATRGLGGMLPLMAESSALSNPDKSLVGDDIWVRFLSDEGLLKALAGEGNSVLHRAFGAAPDLLVSAMRRPAFRTAFIDAPARFTAHGEDIEALRAEIESTGPLGYTEEGWWIDPESHRYPQALLGSLDEGRAVVQERWQGEGNAERRARDLAALEEAHTAFAEVPGLRKAVADSMGLQHLLMESSVLASALRRRPGLLALLVESRGARKALGISERLTAAIASNGKLYDAFLNDAFLRGLIEKDTAFREMMVKNRHMWRVTTSAPLANLITLVPEVNPVLTESERFAEAVFDIPGVLSVLEQAPSFIDQLRRILGDRGAERVEHLNLVVGAVFTTGVDSLTVAAGHPRTTDLLASSPVVARALGEQSGVLPTRESFRDLLGNPELVAALEANEAAARQILGRTELAVLAIREPRFVTAVAEVPGLAALLDHNPDVAALLSKHPALIDTLRTHPLAVPTLRGRARLVSALLTDPALVAELSGQPELWDLLRAQRVLVQDAAAGSDVWRALVSQPGLVEAVLDRPPFFRRLARRPALQQVLLSLQTRLTKEQAGKLLGGGSLVAALDSRPEVAEIIFGDPSLLAYALDTDGFAHGLDTVTGSRKAVAALVAGGPAAIRQAVADGIAARPTDPVTTETSGARPTAAPEETTGDREAAATQTPPTRSGDEIPADADADSEVPAWQDPEIVAWIADTPGVPATLADHPELTNLLFYSPGLFDAVERRPETLPVYAFATFARSARLSWDFESDFQAYHDSLDVMPPGEEGYQAVKEATRGVWRGLADAQRVAEDVRLSVIRARLERFKAIDRSTWEHSGRVVYGNKEGEAWFSEFATEVERVSHGTGLQEGRVALNTALHAHADGGSKGISFAYVLNPEDGQVDALVYGRSSRRPRHGNDYRWDGHGGKAIAGPLATTVVEDVPQFTDSVELTAKLREPGGAAAVTEGLRRGPSATTGPVDTGGVTESEAVRPVTAGGPVDAAGPAGFDADGFDTEWARFGHSERNREDRDWAVDRARVLFSEVRHLPPALDTTSPYARLTPEEKVVRQLAHFILTDSLGRDDVAAKAVLRDLLTGLPEVAPDPLRRTGGAKKKNTGAKKKKAQAAQQPTPSALASSSATSSRAEATMSSSSSSGPAPTLTRDETRRLAERAAKRWVEERGLRNTPLEAAALSATVPVARFLMNNVPTIPADLGIEVADFLTALRSTGPYDPSPEALRELVRHPNVLVAVSNSGSAAQLATAYPALTAQLSTRPKLLRILTDPDNTFLTNQMLRDRNSTNLLAANPQLLDAMEADDHFRGHLANHLLLVNAFHGRADIIQELLAGRHGTARFIAVDNPVFAEFLEGQEKEQRLAVIARLDDNLDLSVAVMDHPDVLADVSVYRTIFESEGLLSALRRHQSQARTVLAIPGMLAVAAADPDVVRVLDGNQDLSDVLIESPDLAIKLAGSRELLDTAYQNGFLAEVLSATPAAFDHLLNDPGALREALASQGAYVWPASDPEKLASQYPLVRISAHPTVRAVFPKEKERELVAKLVGKPKFAESLAAHVDSLVYPHELRRLLGDGFGPLRDAMADNEEFPVGEVLRAFLRHRTLREVALPDPQTLRAVGQLANLHPDAADLLVESPGLGYFFLVSDLPERMFRVADVPDFWEFAKKDALLFAAIHKDVNTASAMEGNHEFLAALMADDGALLRMVREFRYLSDALGYRPDLLPAARGLSGMFQTMADSAATTLPDETAVGPEDWIRFLSDEDLLEVLPTQRHSALHRAFGAAPDLFVSALRRPVFPHAFLADPERFAAHGEDTDALRAEIEGTGPLGYTEEGWWIDPANQRILKLAGGSLEDGRVALRDLEAADGEEERQRAQYLANLEETHLAYEEVPGLREAAAGSLSIRYLLMTNSAFAAMLRRRPGLMPVLLASLDARKALGDDERFAKALATNAGLYNAFETNAFVRESLAGDEANKRSVTVNRHMWRSYDSTTGMTNLFALLPGSRDVMESSESLTEAAFEVPGVMTVLQRSAELFWQFTDVLGNAAPEPVAHLNVVVKAVLTKGLDSLTAVADDSGVVDVLASSPVVARALGDQQGVLPNGRFLVELLDNAELMADLEANEEAARQILSRTDLIVLAMSHPRLVAAVAEVPGLAALLDENPNAGLLLSTHPALIETFLDHPEVAPTLRGRAQLVMALLTNPGLTAALSVQPKLWELLRAQRVLVEDAAEGSDAWRVLVAQPGLVDAVLEQPLVLRRLARRPELQRILLSSQTVFPKARIGRLFTSDELTAVLEGQPEVAELVFGDPSFLVFALGTPEFARELKELAANRRAFADLLARGPAAIREAVSAGIAEKEAGREAARARATRTVQTPGTPVRPTGTEEAVGTDSPPVRGGDDTPSEAVPDTAAETVDWRDQEIAAWVANTRGVTATLTAHPELEGLLFYSPGLFGEVERHPEGLPGYSFTNFAASHPLSWDFESDFQSYRDSLDVMPPGEEGYQAVKDATRGVWQGMRSVQLAAEDARLSEIRERLERFKAIDRSTWEHSGRVVYGNKEGEAWFSEFATEVERVAWGTSFQEGRVALNTALHAHADGGSKGISFAYVLNPEDGQVDALVYGRSSRRRHGNDYRWDGHGAAFPGPLPTTVVDQLPEFTDSVELVEKLRSGGAAAVVEGLRRGPVAATTGPVGTVGGDGVAEREVPRPVTAGGPVDAAGPAGFDADGFDTEWARFGH